MKAVKAWCYFSGYPGVCVLYFLSGSVDAFHLLYHALLESTEINENSVQFQIIKRKDVFLCEVSIEIPSRTVLEKVETFLKSYRKVHIRLPRVGRKHSDPTLYEAFISPLKAFEEGFFYQRSTLHLVALTRAFFHLQTILELESGPSIHLRLMKARLIKGEEEEIELGILIGFKESDDRAPIQEQKMLQAVQAIIPGVIRVPNSFMYCENPKNGHHILYFEVRKMLGGPFSWHELVKLRRFFPGELQNYISSASKAVHFPEDEEEVFNQLSRLGNAVQSVRDLPHVLITFHHVKGKLLFFNLTIVFIQTQGTEILKCLESVFPSTVVIISKHQLSLGLVDKEHVKYASIYSVGLESQFFHRQNQSVDLMGARSYLAKLLENVAGPYRDCNGGLQQKRKQQLDLIRESLGEKGYEHTALLENFFYSLSPTVVQATIPPEIARELFLLFLQIRGQRVREQKGAVWITHGLPSARLLVVKSKERSSLEALLLEIAAFKNTTALLGRALIELEGSYFFCFFQFNHTVDYVQKLCALLEGGHSTAHLAAPLMKKSIRLNFHDGTPFSLNPHMVKDLRQFTLFKLLFECLTEVDRHGNLEMAAAERVDISEAGTLFTFHLRPLQWSNGEKLTAHHFAYAWKKALHPQLGTPRVDIFSPIVNANKAKRGEVALDQVGIYVKDTDTLEVKLERPHANFLELIAHPMASPIYGEHTEPLFFNGPFLAAPLQQGSPIRLVRNPFYWKAEKIRLDVIEISTIRDAHEALERFKKDQLDLLGDPLSPIPLTAIQDAGIQQNLVRRPVWRPYYIYCNTSFFPLNHPKIREALSLSIDRHALARQLNWEYVPLNSPIPSPLSLLKPAEAAPSSVNKATALFDEGLKELGIPFSQFPTLVFHLDDASIYKHIGKVLSERWKEVLGINVHVDYIPWNTLFASFETGKYQMAGMFQTAFYRDPRFYLSMFKESSRLVNRSGWLNADYVNWLQQGEQAVEAEEVRRCLREAERMLVQETVIIPVLNQTYNYLLKKRIKDFEICDYGFVDLTKISID